MENNSMEEYNAVKKNVGFFDFSIEGKIIVNGLGRIDFIDGLVSNDIKNLNENNGIYAAFLDRFGKILSDTIIYKFEDFLLLNLSFLGKRNIISRLKEESRLGKSKVEDATMKYALFSLQGPKSAELLNSITDENLGLKKQYQSIIRGLGIEKTNDKNNLNWKNNETGIIVTKNERTKEYGYDIFVPASKYKECKNLILKKGKEHGIKAINNEVYNILRLEAKIPLFGLDFDEKNIINEVAENAISYSKGCFVGQEIVAKVKNLAQGSTPKKLMALEIDGSNIPEKNAKIVKDGEEAGYITSAAFSPQKDKVVALGFVKKGFYEENDEVLVDNNKANVKSL